MVDVLAVAIFVHQESVALALRCGRAISDRACTKSLFHRFFFDVERNRSCARDDASLIHRRSALRECVKPQRLVSTARNPRFIERRSCFLFRSVVFEEEHPRSPRLLKRYRHSLNG